MMTSREAFEAFISAPPFEMPTERFDDRGAWPGGYTELEVDLAWQAWKAATDAALERAAGLAKFLAHNPSEIQTGSSRQGILDSSPHQHRSHRRDHQAGVQIQALRPLNQK